MKLVLTRTTKFGGWIAIDKNGAGDAFARIYTNKPQTREVDPELARAASIMVAGPELLEACTKAYNSANMSQELRAELKAAIAKAGGAA